MEDFYDKSQHKVEKSRYGMIYKHDNLINFVSLTCKDPVR